MNKYTPGPWVIEENPTIPEGVQIAAFSKGNRELQIIVRSNNADEDLYFISCAPETAAERDRLKEINEDLLKALMQAAEALSHCKADPGYSSMQMRAAIRINSAITKAAGDNQ